MLLTQTHATHYQPMYLFGPVLLLDLLSKSEQIDPRYIIRGLDLAYAYVPGLDAAAPYARGLDEATAYAAGLDDPTPRVRGLDAPSEYLEGRV